MLNKNKSVQMRDGRSAKIIHTMTDGNIVAVITESDGAEVIYQLTSTGHFLADHTQSRHDLVNAPEKVVSWAALMHVHPKPEWGMPHTNRSYAVTQAVTTFLTKWLLRTELVEGQPPVVTVERI